MSVAAPGSTAGGTRSGGGASAKFMASGDSDMFKVAEKKRGEADKVRYELNNALKELLQCQSQLMSLEREREIISTQLQRASGLPPPAATTSSPATASAAIATATASPIPPRAGAVTTAGKGAGATAPAAVVIPEDDISRAAHALHARSNPLLSAVYETEGIRNMVAELEAVKQDTAEIEFRAKIYEHMRQRLSNDEIETRRQARQLQDQLTEERARLNDMRRRESEITRQLTTSHAKLASLQKNAETQIARWKQEIKERRSYVRRRKEYNASLEAQIQSSAASSGKLLPHDRLPSVRRLDDALLPVRPQSMRQLLPQAEGGGGGGALDDAAFFCEALQAMGISAPDVAAILSPTDAACAASSGVGATPSVSGAAAGATGVSAVRNLNKAGAAGTGVGPSRTRAGTAASAAPMLMGGSGMAGTGTLPMVPSLDPEFLTKHVQEQMDIKLSLLQRLESEDLRASEIQRHLGQLRSSAATAVSSGARSTSPARSPTHTTMSSPETKLPDTATTLARPSNRDLAQREAALLDVDKQLKTATSEHEFLMNVAMPVRLGLAGMAKKLLDGESVTIDDAEHARSVLLRLTARCASIVDEIRKAIALKDPEGHQTADWATLQSEELAEALAAARRLPTGIIDAPQRGAILPGSSTDDVQHMSTYFSPYNVRVAAGNVRNGKAPLMPSRSLADNSQLLTQRGSTMFTVAGSDDSAEDEGDNDDGATGLGGAAQPRGDEDEEDMDVLNRGELKKMSQKLLRYRKRVDAPAVGGGGGSGSAAGGYEAASNTVAGGGSSVLAGVGGSTASRRPSVVDMPASSSTSPVPGGLSSTSRSQLLRSLARHKRKAGQ